MPTHQEVIETIIKQRDEARAELIRAMHERDILRREVARLQRLLSPPCEETR